MYDDDGDHIIQGPADLSAFLHTGGITDVFQVPRHLLSDVITQLTTCTKHGASHVFVVDQSQAGRFAGYIRIGVSKNGLDCIKETEFF